MIEFYLKDNDNFESNGDMVLIPTSCELTCEINGAWELTMNHPLDNDGRWKYLEEEGVIACPTFVGDHQLFRVDKLVKTEDNITCTAYPLFFDSGDDCFLMDVRPEVKTGQEALDIMMEGSVYSGESNITTTSTAYFVRRNLMDAINGEDSPTFIERWGGECLFDNRKIIINNRIGGDYGVEIRYGRNMDGLSYAVDMSDVVTRIIPVGYNGRLMNSDCKWADSKKTNKYAKIYAQEMKFENIRYYYDDPELSDRENSEYYMDLSGYSSALYGKAMNQFWLNHVDLPKITIEVNMVDLSRTEEYKDFEQLIDVSLGDTVHCYNSKLDITTDARVIKLTWDCIQNTSESMTLGDYESTYFSELTRTLKAVENCIDDKGSLIAERVTGTLNAINTQLRYQKTVAQKSDVRAILFEDLDESSETYGAMCLGTQGFQIANKRTTDGKSWDWTTAFTAKGGYADAIITGILSSQDGSSYWDLDTGELHLTGTFQQITSAGLQSVAIQNNQIQFFDWKNDGEYVGAIGSVRADDGSNNGVELWADKGKRITLGVASSKGSDASIKNVFYYDDTLPNDTPWIINTANGNLLPNNPGGGITIEHGLVKTWNFESLQNSSLKFITGLGWNSNKGLTKYETTTLTIKDGLIVASESKWSNT